MVGFLRLRKAFFSILSVMLISMISASACSAEEFTQVYSSGRISLKENKVLVEKFPTAFGEMTLQFRRLFGTSSKKRFHFIVELGDKTRIADEYFPSLKSGYTIKAFRDQSNNRVFLAVQTKYHAWLLGYNEKLKKMLIYADSGNYWAPEQSRPEFVVRGERIHLMYTYQENKKYQHMDYELYWDDDAMWFGYIDNNKEDVVEYEPEPVFEQTHMPEPMEDYDEVIITTR